MEQKSKRKLQRRGWGKKVYYECSNCRWYFEFSVQVDAPPEQTEEQLKSIHEEQRNAAFEQHNCADHPNPKSSNTP
jgi:hypothetical protein